MESLRIAEIIARNAHSGQYDKGGHPYIKHPETIASMVQTYNEKIVAWLHDVIEDTEWTLDDLIRVGFSLDIVDAVDAITKRKDENRLDYLNRVVTNPIARNVKIADLKHNMDLSRISKITNKDRIRSYRYRLELLYLEYYYG